jgi:hypothetical protein
VWSAGLYGIGCLAGIGSNHVLLVNNCRQLYMKVFNVRDNGWELAWFLIWSLTAAWHSCDMASPCRHGKPNAFSWLLALHTRNLSKCGSVADVCATSWVWRAVPGPTFKESTSNGGKCMCNAWRHGVKFQGCSWDPRKGLCWMERKVEPMGTQAIRACYAGDDAKLRTELQKSLPQTCPDSIARPKLHAQTAGIVTWRATVRPTC